MSALSSISAGVPASNLAPMDQALEPASVRHGNQAAKNAYAEGVAFENVLVNELAQAMTQTVPGLDGSSSASGDGLGGSSGATDLSGSGSGLGAYASLLPQTLATGIMGNGGTGVAMQIATAIDPALGHPVKK